MSPQTILLALAVALSGCRTAASPPVNESPAETQPSTSETEGGKELADDAGVSTPAVSISIVAQQPPSGWSQQIVVRGSEPVTLMAEDAFLPITREELRIPKPIPFQTALKSAVEEEKSAALLSGHEPNRTLSLRVEPGVSSGVQEKVIHFAADAGLDSVRLSVGGLAPIELSLRKLAGDFADAVPPNRVITVVVQPNGIRVFDGETVHGIASGSTADFNAVRIASLAGDVAATHAAVHDLRGHYDWKAFHDLLLREYHANRTADLHVSGDWDVPVQLIADAVVVAASLTPPGDNLDDLYRRPPDMFTPRIW